MRQKLQTAKRTGAIEIPPGFGVRARSAALDATNPLRPTQAAICKPTPPSSALTKSQWSPPLAPETANGKKDRGNRNPARFWSARAKRRFKTLQTPSVQPKPQFANQRPPLQCPNKIPMVSSACARKLQMAKRTGAIAIPARFWSARAKRRFRRCRPAPSHPSRNLQTNTPLGAVPTKPAPQFLLHRHALGQVARLIHVAAASDGDMVGQQLQRNHGQQREQRLQSASGT